MAQQWTSVKSVFEALSYIVKPMSPDGIDLYFTVSYSTYRRNNTSELLEFLNKKVLEGVTDISYRLKLELENYATKIQQIRRKSSKSSTLKKIRPISIYILTNGKWRSEGDPIGPIKEM